MSDQTTKTTAAFEAVAEDVALLESESNKSLKRDHIATAHALYLQITRSRRVSAGSAIRPVLLRAPIAF